MFAEVLQPLKRGLQVRFVRHLESIKATASQIGQLVAEEVPGSA